MSVCSSQSRLHMHSADPVELRWPWKAPWGSGHVYVYVFLHQCEKLLSLRIWKPITFANGTTFPFRNSKLIVLFAGAIGNWAGGGRTNGFSFLKQETSESRSKGNRNKLNVVHECDKKAYFSIYLKATRRTEAFNPQMWIKSQTKNEHWLHRSNQREK